MIDAIVYKPSSYGLVVIHDKPVGLRPRLTFQKWVLRVRIRTGEFFLIYLPGKIREIRTFHLLKGEGVLGRFSLFYCFYRGEC